MRRSAAVLALTLTLAAIQATTAVSATPPRSPHDSEPLVVRPGSPALHYEGRWEVDDHRATTVNSGSRILLRFHGDEVNATFDLDGIEYPPHLYAYVDGVRSEPIVLDQERVRLTPQDLPTGEHELMLAVKDIDEHGNRWVPPFASGLHVTGFELPAGSTVRPVTPADGPRMTFLGDSITQGVNVTCDVSGSDCADATLDYAWLVADAFDAHLEQVGFGAQGVTRGGNGSVPPAAQALDLNFAASPASRFNAHVVVINQGTNDAFAGAEAEAIRSAYLDYLHRVRHRYPGATILALEPVGIDGAGTTAGEPIRRAVAAFDDERTDYVPTTGWTGPADFTEGVHPNAAGHRAIADRLIELISDRTRLRP